MKTIAFADANPCESGHRYDSKMLTCIHDPLLDFRDCDTFDDRCPRNFFCSPRFLKCLPSLTENDQCPDYFPLREVILCNKVNHLYCFNNECQKVTRDNTCNAQKCSSNKICNPLRGICERRIEKNICDPQADLCYINSNSYCHPKMKICINYFSEGDNCDLSILKCNPKLGLKCNSKKICERK
ncbi:unnamed protein product [Brachionus calyciflorus]|uniref:Uncharacterized protein n=1 Tax=Brachionus calyciflorus TaxID=104777 RepID=A0A814LFL2_9BILA|nr:unnamed protein product [Brachionus calyciflorus]